MTNPTTFTSSKSYSEVSDVILIGSGIMSANLGAMLKRLDPRLTIQVFEGLAQEASDGWNNAGTDHAGICEVNYTPTRDADGCVNVGRALAIFEQFEYSKQFRSYAVATDLPFSVRAGNLGALIRSGVRNQSLVRYLVKQALQSMEDRLTALKEFYPMASKDDWRLVEAGIRVQTIKKVNRGEHRSGSHQDLPARTPVFSRRSRSHEGNATNI